MLSGSIDPHYAIAGFLVGALVGVTGVGGGSLMTPILIVLFGVSPATAVGTDLLFAAATKHTLVSLLAGSLLGIFVGSSISARVPDTALRYLLAAVLNQNRSSPGSAGEAAKV
jgi:uncharacterized protein